MSFEDIPEAVKDSKSFQFTTPHVPQSPPQYLQPEPPLNIKHGIRIRTQTQTQTYVCISTMTY